MPTSDRKTKVQTTGVILMFLLVFGWAQGLPGLAPEAWGANPAVTTPATGSTLAGSTATFTWEANGTAVTEWWLYVGKSRGTKEVLTSGSIPATTLSRTVTGLPTNGSPVWVRLWWKTLGKWHFQDVQYRAATATGGGSTPGVTTPAPQSTLAGSTATFTWEANGTAVTEWWLYVGKSRGTKEVLTSGSLSVSRLSRTVTGLPTNGSSVWVRLWWWTLAKGWQWVDVQYRATTTTGGGSNPEVTTPATNSTLAGSTATFSWKANGTAVTEWWLYVGKSQGTKEVLTSGSIPASTLSRTVTSIPTNGSPVWVRLWWRTAAQGWQWVDVPYTAATQTGNIPMFTDMTIKGLKAFVDRHHITDVKTVLSSMPSWYMRNYALVETSRTGLPSSVEHPRLILPGSDARFMMAIGTHPGHPSRETIDIAQLDPNTGFWIFRALDMSQAPPKLSADDTACQTCHGNPSRPIWGGYPKWPGFFGPRDDGLVGAQRESLNHIVATKDQSDRFHNIEFASAHDRAHGQHTLVGRHYSYTNNVIGRELSTAMTTGLFLRIKSHSRYAALREGFLLLFACDNRIRPVPSDGLKTSPAWLRFQDAMTDAGARLHEQELFRVLGIDVYNDFPLQLLADEALEAKQTWNNHVLRWSNGETNRVEDMVRMLVLNDLLPDAPGIREILANTPEPVGFGVGQPNILKFLEYIIQMEFVIKGEARQQARKMNYKLNSLRATQGILMPIQPQLCEYYANKLD